MQISIIPKYKPITEKEYCCVPAVIQMIQERRGLEFASQDEIGYQLGLIVPRDKAHLYFKPLTGNMPRGGWGTQIGDERYSINNYFARNNIQLKIKMYKICDIEDVSKFIRENLVAGNDLIVCYNSNLLFGLAGLKNETRHFQAQWM